MANQDVAADDPRLELARSRDLARQVRRSQRATWFPLLVFATLTFMAVPVTLTGHVVRTVCRATPNGPPGTQICLGHNSAAFIYWPIALVLAYVAIAAFYVRQSHARGVGTRVRPYMITGIAIAIALTAASLWAQHRPPLAHEYDVLGWHMQPPDLYRFIAPACAIGFGLLVLAAVERNLALLGVTLVYLVIAVAPVNFGWTTTGPSRWTFLPYLVIPGSALLLAGAGFAAAQRPAPREMT